MRLFDNNNYYFSITMSLTMMLMAVGLTLAFQHSRSEDLQDLVVNLTVKSTGPTALDLEWTPSQQVDKSVRYLLTYSAGLTNEVRFVDGQNFTLTELKECTAYTIAVTCAYGTGENVRFGPSASATSSTSHASPLNAVKNLTVVTTNDSALIAWENPAEQQPCVAHRLVRLALSESDAVTTGTLQTESARYSATALEPCGTYRGHVTAVDFAGDRGNPAPFDFTADIAIPGPVSKLSAISNDSQSIFVSWAEPQIAPLCIHQYEVVYCYDVFVCSALSTRVNSVTISHLKPCVTYQITVTPKVADTVNGLSMKVEATVVAEALSKPKNGRVLFLTNYTATLQWDPPTSISCNLIEQIVNCSYLNNSFEVKVTNNQTRQVVMGDLKPFTKYTCHSVFFTEESNSAKSDELVFWTKMKVPDPPINLSVKKVNSYRAILTWAPPATMSPGVIDGYRWTVTFKNYLYQVPKNCPPQTDNDTMTYVVKNYHTYEYTIRNLRPASIYSIELSASTESGFGNSTNITIHTLSSISSMVEDLKTTSIQSNSVLLSWKYPCVPNGKVAFFHSTFVGERVGYNNHIFSIKHDISENETEFVYSLTNVLPEYKYMGTVVAINYNVDTPGQDNRIRFITPSTSPSLPSKYDTYRRLRVTKVYLTHIRVSIPDDLFSNANGNIKYYSIIVYQDGGFPDIPEHGNANPYDVWPPVTRTWAEAAQYPFILAYQTTPDQWMPFTKQKETIIYDIGADESCRNSDERIYCNGPLRPVTEYRLKLRAFTENGFQDSWTVPFTSPGESTAVYYLVLCSVLFAVLITVFGTFCMLNEKVPWAVKYRLIETSAMESGLPGDMNAKQLLAKGPQEIETEFNLLAMYVKSSPSADVAAMPQNGFKNRYVNALPYDFNRVIVKSSDGDYVNASFIEDYRGVRRYIACQGPMKNTCVDMWQMILDQNVASVVMLCQTTENDKVKCEKYYPNSKEILIFGDIQVKNDIMIVDENHSFTTRILTVLKGDVKKTIRHFQFHGWPDFGIPDDPLTLLRFCLMVQAKSPMGLTVVHCSAGVGRTGTYIACDMLLRQALQDSTKFNIFKIVLKLREQRANMVQTQAQYEFVYGLLRHYTKQYLQTRKSLGSEKKSLDGSAAPVNETDASSAPLAV